MADPHYRIAGISLLPKSVAKWWAVSVLKVTSNYEVGIFPVYSLMIQSLREHGLHVRTSGHHSYILETLRNPFAVRPGLKRRLLLLGRAIGVNSLLSVLIANTSSSFWVIGHKP